MPLGRCPTPVLLPWLAMLQPDLGGVFDALTFHPITDFPCPWQCHRKLFPRLSRQGRCARAAIDGDPRAAVWLLRCIDLPAALTLLQAGVEQQSATLH